MLLTDFIQYWSAAKVLLTGGDPYSAAALLDVQSALRPEADVAIRMWNPPWTLPLVAPLGLVSYRTAGVVFTTLSVAIALGTGYWLWRRFGGGELGAWLGAAVALIFPPMLLSIGMGQISPWLLVGVVAFLCFERRGSGILAGASLSLVLVKPHYLYLLVPALILHARQRRRWGSVWGLGAGLLGLTLLALLLNPDILAQYWSAVADRPPSYFVAPSAGVLMRLLLGWERTWPALLPVAIGGLWLVWYAYSVRDGLQWPRDLPTVMFASVITAPYGWVIDEVVFLIPLIWLAVPASRGDPKAMAGLTIMVLVSVAMVRMQFPVFTAAIDPDGTPLRGVLTSPNVFWHILFPPLLLAGWLVGRPQDIHPPTKAPGRPATP